MFRLASVLLVLLLATQFIAQAGESALIHARDKSSMDGSSKRSAFSIIWGCISTTIICAWAAIHPNIPPREGPVKGTLRRVELMVSTIIAPEILPCWALRQLLAAMTVRDVYNNAQGYEEDGIWKSVKGWFSWYQIKRWFSFYERKEPASQAWTVKHGHFLVMGGIHLVEPVEENSRSREVSAVGTPLAEGTNAEKGPVLLTAEVEGGRVTILTLEMLRELVKDPSFKIRIAEDEISDRAKGDALSKLIFMLQTSWFITQCIARHFQGLALTHLELTILAMASLNGITFILWWEKPLGAQAFVRVHVNRKLTDAERDVDSRRQSARSVMTSFVTKRCARFVTWIHDSDWPIIFGAGSIILAIVAHPFLLIIASVSLVSAGSFDVIGSGSTFFAADAAYVSTFYVPTHKYYRFWHLFVLIALGSTFGAIHCAAWNFPFPTYAEQKLWRSAALAVTILPIIAIPFGIIVVIFALVIIKRIFPADAEVPNFRPMALVLAILIFAPMYTAARLILLGQAIALLRHLPPSALVAVDWTQFYPHFF